MVKTRQVLLAALFLQLSWISGKNEVEQSPPYLTAQEGDYITINCSHRVGVTTLNWLQQKPGGGCKAPRAIKSNNICAREEL
ncbi:T Cell Receptor Alpha Variable 41 [Manis pentadactyla]|nr:T Cell Receptor Alpha Variable 41 [Manis pentadactyla]